jgi:neuronal calcium sensor 1
MERGNGAKADPKLPPELSHVSITLPHTSDGNIACNFGRHHPEPHPTHINDPGYQQWKQKQAQALRIGINGLEQQRRKHCLFDHIVFEASKLTFCPSSQSKLSAADLADLQKATKFDKKELQQWYKGTNAKS